MNIVNSFKKEEVFMKKVIKIASIFLVLIALTACKTKDNEDALKFKEDYESLNGVETSREGVYYREITIDEDNPFVYSTIEQINKSIENKESFIVYFGANWCPWCRSVLPTAIEEAKKAEIETIYYIDVRPDNVVDNDLRDIYSLDDNNKIYLSHKGTEAYHKFLEYANDILPDYSSHGVSVEGTEFEGAKRVGAPSFILVKKGTPIERISGVSEAETDPYMELTREILEDMSEDIQAEPAQV